MGPQGVAPTLLQGMVYPNFILDSRENRIEERGLVWQGG